MSLYIKEINTGNTRPHSHKMYINVWKILKFCVKQVNIKQDASI